MDPSRPSQLVHNTVMLIDAVLVYAQLKAKPASEHPKVKLKIVNSDNQLILVFILVINILEIIKKTIIFLNTIVSGITHLYSILEYFPLTIIQ